MSRSGSQTSTLCGPGRSPCPLLCAPRVVVAVAGLLSRARRGFGVAAIAGVLVFAVPIQSAHALTPPAPLIWGALRAAAPGAAALVAPVCATGVGCVVLGVAAVGVGLYLTRDSWMPWLSEHLGEAGTSGGTGTLSTLCSNLTWSGPSTGDATQMGVQLQMSGTCDGNSNYITGRYACKSTSSGAIGSGTFGGYQTLYTNGVTVGGPPPAPSTNTHNWISCSAGTTLIEASAQLTANANPATSGVKDLYYSTGYDPKGATYTTTAHCLKPDGSYVDVTVTTVAPGTEGLRVPACEEHGAPVGSHATCITVKGGVDPGRVLSTGCAPTTDSLYPNCVGAGVACSYVIRLDGIACTVGQAGCTAWAREYDTHPERLQCYWGSYLLSISSCNQLERAYEPNGAYATVANTDGVAETYTEPAPAWVTTPVTPPDGAPGGGPAQVPGTQIVPLPTQTNNADCWPSGVAAWNPAEWVLTPVKCALTWAFVPRTATMTTLAATATADLTAVGIAPLAGAVGANFEKIGSGSGCEGPAVTFSAVGVVKPLHPFSACSEPMATLAGISYAVTTVVCVLGGGFAAMRAVGAGFGFNMSMGRGESS